MRAVVGPGLRPALSCPRSFMKAPRNNTIYNVEIPETQKMQSQSKSKFKRPTCPKCTRPTALCLCIRIPNPSIDNQIHVTILQHSLERDHPLNSARIARLGLRNVSVVTVYDVNLEARFEIRPIECASGVCGNVCERVEYESGLVAEECGIAGSVPLFGRDDKKAFDRNSPEQSSIDRDEDRKRLDDDVFSISIEKRGMISSIDPPWTQRPEQNEIGVDQQFLDSALARGVLGKGFVVKKLQKRQNSGTLLVEEVEEFDISVPAGSALLFPASEAVDAESASYEVRNLIVLDGTWAKANRMYNENPWLRFLPCVRLDIDKISLFSGVRRQPKPGYLSTIESIVYAMESLGSGNLVGLYGLLNVFDSMVNDQKRLKDERLRKVCS